MDQHILSYFSEHNRHVMSRDEQMEVIAIDGPAGSGKSTIARFLAEKLNYQYIDSGSLYRAITLLYIQQYQKEGKGKVFKDWFFRVDFQKLKKLIELRIEFNNRIENRIFLNSKDVSVEIRNPEVTEKIRFIADHFEIREFVNQFLREFAKNHKIVMDGRDIGTIVFPKAKYKFFLTAPSNIRTIRRKEELAQKGILMDEKELKQQIEKRDKEDESREIAPLVKAVDAILVDTGELTINDVITRVLAELQNC